MNFRQLLFSGAALFAPALIGASTASAATVTWDFSNATSAGSVSTSVGASNSTNISGTFSQTGGGPVENFGPVYGNVFLTRSFGPNSAFIQLTLNAQMRLDTIAFDSIHNHNPTYATEFGYDVNLLLDSGAGFETVNSFFATVANSGTTTTLAINRTLEAGNYTLAFAPNSGFDSTSEFFALDNVALNATDTPEPGTVLMLGAGLALVAFQRRRA